MSDVLQRWLDGLDKLSEIAISVTLSPRNVSHCISSGLAHDGRVSKASTENPSQSCPRLCWRLSSCLQTNTSMRSRHVDICYNAGKKNIQEQFTKLILHLSNVLALSTVPKSWCAGQVVTIRTRKQCTPVINECIVSSTKKTTTPDGLRPIEGRGHDITLLSQSGWNDVWVIFFSLKVSGIIFSANLCNCPALCRQEHSLVVIALRLRKHSTQR